MSTAIKHIAVAGNIGAGKTSLAAQLSKHYSWDVMFEDASDNPYLSDFYFDMSRWSFNLQIHFYTAGTSRYWLSVQEKCL